jgi:hydantoinase/carbamoylase family amidase
MLMRRDALLGASRLVLRTNEIALREGRGIATVGSLTVSPNVANIIPGQVALTVDFRHPTKSGLARLRNDLVSEVKRVGKMTHLNVKVEERSFAKPSRMSRRLIDSIASNTRSLGLRYKKMNSGAGHDCQNMARITSAGMIFVPSIAGLSHVPGESTSSEDLEAGANVLLNTLLQLLGGERV